METFWCCEKNPIIDNYQNPDFNPALVPCIKEQCQGWNKREGRARGILFIKEGKPERV
jgi:hypothetical protein